MKLSRPLHVASVLTGAAGIVSALVGVWIGADGLAWGLTREHWLACSGLLMLIAIWTTLSTMHHKMLERNGEWI